MGIGEEKSFPFFYHQQSRESALPQDCRTCRRRDYYDYQAQKDRHPANCEQKFAQSICLQQFISPHSPSVVGYLTLTIENRKSEYR